MPVTCTQPALTQDTECDTLVKGGVRRSVQLQNEKRSDGTVNGRDNIDTLKTVSTKKINLLLLGTYL